MTTLAALTAELKARAVGLGFNRVGVIPAAPARRLDAYLAWIAAGRHGEMGYMARPDRVARRRDLDVVLPGARSLVVVGLDYATAPLPPHIAADPARGRFSNYAWGADYHEVMTPRLEALGEWLATESWGAGASPPRPLGEGRGAGASPLALRERVGERARQYGRASTLTPARCWSATTARRPGWASPARTPCSSTRATARGFSWGCC
ncbi:MAG: DUF1730 domain-containing protein [Candidatus Promineofilum sp.]|nr:DUF1730 domain-containing protein [Promineifilum sp.]